MANKKHLDLLKQRTLLKPGVFAWNEWRKNNPEITPDLSGADLSQANLIMMNLSGADLSGAEMNFAVFSMAELIGANLSEAKLMRANLNLVNLYGANLSRANLSFAELGNADFRMTNLRGAELSYAFLCGSNFSMADLREVRLIGTQAGYTNFNGALFTGTCLEDWNINSATNLSSVICEYVYLRDNQQERRPSSGNFAPGEFKELLSKALETVDLIFSNTIEWNAFAYSFKKVQVENEGAQLDIQSIEKKGDGILVVRVGVSPDADKAKIHGDFMEGYEFARRALEAQYQARIEDKDKEINRLFDLVNQRSKVLDEVTKQLANAPKYDQRYAQIGSLVDKAQNGSRQQSINHQHSNDETKKQALDGK
jgi:uncharacterized protein YjbI with pentapeptide repeats